MKNLIRSIFGAKDKEVSRTNVIAIVGMLGWVASTLLGWDVPAGMQLDPTIGLPIIFLRKGVGEQTK